MSGQPPVTPPTLSYKSKAQREKEDRERREREEAERRERERLESERAAGARAEEAERRRALTRPPAPAGGAPPPPPSPPPLPRGRTTPEVTTPRPSVQDGRSLVMFEEDGLAPTRREIDDIEMLGPVEEEVFEEEEVEEEEVVRGPKRRPPRPPKSPDMRPVFVGFILVFTGLAQFIYGILAMLGSPSVATGPWSTMARWGAFSMGFAAVFLGLLAIRGGMWSFRKERFSVVKIGAVAATICAWAWWVPWLFGLAALLIIIKARDEYYPFYDPSWDAPEWARPPPSVEREEGAKEEEGEEEEAKEEEGVEVEGQDEASPADASARDFLDDVSPPDDKEASGLQDADVSTGDGWDDVT